MCFYRLNKKINGFSLLVVLIDLYPFILWFSYQYFCWDNPSFLDTFFLYKPHNYSGLTHQKLEKNHLVFMVGYPTILRGNSSNDIDGIKEYF